MKMKTYEIRVFGGVRAFAAGETTAGDVGIVTMQGRDGYHAVARAVKEGFIDPDEDGIGKVEEVTSD